MRERHRRATRTAQTCRYRANGLPLLSRRRSASCLHTETVTTSAERLLDGVEMATVVLRVADLDRSVAWYSEKLGLTPLHRGADGNTPPYAVYDVSGIIVTVWQLW